MYLEFQLRRVVLFAGLAVLSTQTAMAAKPEIRLAPPIFAQQLVDQTVEHQKGILDLIFHVTPPQEKQNYAIAAFTEKERGAKSGADDLDVATTGQPVVEVQKDGVRIGVLLPLKDRQGATIGTLGIVYTYKAGQAEQPFLRRSQSIRDTLARQIPAREALFVRAAQR